MPIVRAEANAWAEGHGETIVTTQRHSLTTLEPSIYLAEMQREKIGPWFGVNWIGGGYLPKVSNYFPTLIQLKYINLNMLCNLLHHTHHTSKYQAKISRHRPGKWLKINDKKVIIGKFSKSSKKNANFIKENNIHFFIFYFGCFKWKNTRKRKLILSRSCGVNTIFH